MRRRQQQQLENKINSYRIIFTLITGIFIGYLLGGLWDSKKPTSREYLITQSDKDTTGKN